MQSLLSEPQWMIAGVCLFFPHLPFLRVSVLLRELELQRKSSATDIAKKKQEAESAVSTRTSAAHSSWWGVIDRGFWAFFLFFSFALSSLCLKKRLSNSILLSSAPPSAPRLSLSLGSSAGSADAGVCEENHRSGRIQDGLEEHTHTRRRRRYDRLRCGNFYVVLWLLLTAQSCTSFCCSAFCEVCTLMRKCANLSKMSVKMIILQPDGCN